MSRATSSIKQFLFAACPVVFVVSLYDQNSEFKAEIAAAGLRKAPGLPDIIPGLVRRYRELVEGIARLGNDPAATSDDVQRARGILRDLFGRIPVEPAGEVLVATVAATAAGLVKSPASINPSFVVAGACFALSRSLPGGYG